MSAAAAAADDHGHHDQGDHGHDHHEESWIRHYLFSIDHKMISRQFLFTSILLFILGGFLAVAVRWQIAWPWTKIPMVGLLVGHETAGSGLYDVLTPEGYYAAMTMHASVMIFLVIIPLLIGFFGNWCIPLMIGAGDMAFPRLNMWSYWMFLTGSVFFLASFFVEGGPAGAGWTAYPPLSAIQIGNGVNLWGLGVLFTGFSSVMGAVNYITTILKLRAPGMSLFRMPLVVWSIFITSALSLLATPVLASNVLMLFLDRVAGTSFFIPDGLVEGGLIYSGELATAAPERIRAGGGQVLMFQHLFWFYSHPAVYIMVLPAMGIASDILSCFARKPIFGYKPMVYAMGGITGLGFIVWGHHMFQSGMNPYLGMTFMVSTMFIALPSAIKVFNWLGTIWRGQIHYHTPMLWALAFVGMFIIGGLSGIWMAALPVDIHIHDTYFIVGHIHYVVFASTVVAIFGAIYFWFPKMFGRMLNERLGKIHFWLTFIFLNGTFMLMHYVGAQGHPRRIAVAAMTEDVIKAGGGGYEFLKDYHWANVVMTICAIALGFSQLVFFTNMVFTLIKGPKAPDNPWRCNTLDWATPTPPPHGNFTEAIVVYRGPYEYSHPDMKEDFAPQHVEDGSPVPGSTKIATQA
ncbi:MAG: cbb3-type cytochrome c oxidase subunit I [Planctomycetes bacterium]|nr:cbb3-type cytochrome c oxidase subunit I [Planctomycetota bacterium]